MFFEQTIQKFRACPGTVNRYIRGDCGTLDIPTITTALREGNHTIRIPVEISKSFQTGSCYLFSVHSFKCNPLDYVLDRRVIVSDPISFFVERDE